MVFHLKYGLTFLAKVSMASALGQLRERVAVLVGKLEGSVLAAAEVRYRFYEYYSIALELDLQRIEIARQETLAGITQ